MDVGVIGIGTMGKNHVRVYSKIRAVDDIYVLDVNKNNCRGLEDYGVLVCDSLDELLNKVDAVNICVPTEHHFNIAKKVIAANLHCLIEKPISLTIEQGEQLLDMVCNGLIVGVGHIERFNPIVNEVKKVADNISYCGIKRHNPSSTRITDSTVVKDLMIHDIDIIFNVLFKNKTYDFHCAGNRDVCSSLIDFKDSIASVSASRISSKKIRSIYVEEKEFTIEGDFMTQEVYVYSKPDRYSIKDERYVQENIIEKVLLNKVEPLFVELHTFVDCITSHTEFPVTVEQAVNNLKICEKMERSFGWDMINTKPLL